MRRPGHRGTDVAHDDATIVDIVMPGPQPSGCEPPDDLTLDDDVAARIDGEVRRSGRAYRAVVNDALRRGLESGASDLPPFKLQPHPPRHRPRRCQRTARSPRRAARPVILLDANVLLSAFDATSPAHDRARAWLTTTLETEADVRISIATVLAFVRIATDPRVFVEPMSTGESIAVVETLLDRPNVALVVPTARHWALFAQVAAVGQARGPLLMDAHLAALAMEHGATLATSDRDSRRFTGLKIADPLAA
jgi:toxin-antitoxin system PIN domain toxin